MRLGFFDVPTLLAAATFASSVHAGSLDIHTEQIDPGSVLPNHVVNHVLVDFTEAALRGQQMVMKLTQGSIYQFPGPNDMYIAVPLWFPPVFPPDLRQQYDSWVGIGQPQEGTSLGVLAVGCAANIPGGCDPSYPPAGKFDSEGISIAWAPPTGVDLPPSSGLITAQMTLTDNAQGT